MPDQNTPSSDDGGRQAGVQLRLPIEDAPPKVRAHGYSDAHERPLVGQTRRGKIVASFRVEPSVAWKFRYLELNPANASSVLVFDCDDPETLLRVFPPFGGPSELPEPNWKSWNRKNGHAHVVYCFRAAVHRNLESRSAPQIRLAAIAEAYAAKLNADDGYAGILSRNPMTRPHRGAARTQWGRQRGYCLDELAEPVGIGRSAHLPRIETARTAEGRNCITFELSMRWAGSKKHAELPVLPVALGINKQFSVPLGFSEVAHIAKHVEGYRAQWIAGTGPVKGRRTGGFYDHSSALQAARGKKGGHAKAKKLASENEERNSLIVLARTTTGATQQELAAEFGLHQTTVGRILRRAGPQAQTGPRREGTTTGGSGSSMRLAYTDSPPDRARFGTGPAGSEQSE